VSVSRRYLGVIAAVGFGGCVERAGLNFWTSVSSETGWFRWEAYENEKGVAELRLQLLACRNRIVLKLRPDLTTQNRSGVDIDDTIGSARKTD
jgi:hypothetical protein